MVVLLGIGFLAGVITAVSPCVLPVLPIILAGGATGSRRRPFAIIAGLVASFTLFTLVASALLSALGLPQDFLRNLAIAMLFVLAATLLVPQIGYVLERPFAFLTRRRGSDVGGGFVLGVSLGLVFVPCAGPVLATITALSAEHRVSFDTVLLTLAYAVGAAVPMLLIALGGQRVATPAASARPELPARHGRRARRGRVRAHLQCLAEPADRARRLHDGDPEARRGDVARDEASRRAQGRRQRVRRGRSEGAEVLAPGSRQRARLRRDRRLAQHARQPSALARVLAREGGARSTSGRTRASTASGRCRICAPGTRRTTRTAS